METIRKLLEGSPTSHITKNVLEILASNARLRDVNKVIDAYSELMKAERKEVPTPAASFFRANY